jgi:hypothetical protein
MSETTPHDELTAETLDELERLEREASGAPWVRTDAVLRDHIGQRVCSSAFSVRFDADMDLVVAVRNALPALIASARLAAARGERIAELEDMATLVVRHCNEAAECPFCGNDDGEHSEAALCWTLDRVLNGEKP